jgi:hypothetical protein
VYRARLRTTATPLLGASIISTDTVTQHGTRSVRKILVDLRIVLTVAVVVFLAGVALLARDVHPPLRDVFR